MQDEMENNSVIHRRPVVLHSKDRHALWVSQHIPDAMAPIPAHVEGGHIVRHGTESSTGLCTLQMS